MRSSHRMVGCLWIHPHEYPSHFQIHMLLSILSSQDMRNWSLCLCVVKDVLQEAKSVWKKWKGVYAVSRLPNHHHCNIKARRLCS